MHRSGIDRFRNELQKIIDGNCFDGCSVFPFKFHADQPQPASSERPRRVRKHPPQPKTPISCIGIQRGFGIAPDFVLFQPTVTTLAVPLSTFANPDEAIAAIKAKLAQSGFGGEK